MIPFWFVIFYYTTHGMIYGGGLGILVGTLILPVLGTMVGMLWGGVVGFFLGVINGIVVSIVQRIFFDEYLDAERFRSWLIRVTALVTIVFGTVPLAVIFMPFAVMLFAYLSHAFVSDHYQLKRKNNTYIAKHYTSKQTTQLITEKFDHRGAYLTILSIVGIIVLALKIANVPLPNIVKVILFSPPGIVFGVVYGTVGLWLFGILNAMLIIYLNAIHFRTIHDVEQYRWRIKILMAVVSTLGSVVVAAVIFAPLVGYVAWRVGDDYVDWALGEKAKREITATSPQS